LLGVPAKKRAVAQSRFRLIHSSWSASPATIPPRFGQGGSFSVGNCRRTRLNCALVSYSAQHESFDGSLRREMATIFNASAIVVGTHATIGLFRKLYQPNPLIISDGLDVDADGSSKFANSHSLVIYSLNILLVSRPREGSFFWGGDYYRASSNHCTKAVETESLAASLKLVLSSRAFYTWAEIADVHGGLGNLRNPSHIQQNDVSIGFIGFRQRMPDDNSRSFYRLARSLAES
jgi:hypothetical protein